MKKILALLGFDPLKHSVKVEMMAGLTTFLTMSYILAVNPLILGETGMDKGALFTATIAAAVIATLVMAFYAKMPFALASGMGLNAFFAYTLVLTMGYTWQEALAAVLFEGIVFILLTFFKVREAIVNAIPQNLRYSISVGIGLFIAYIGLKNGGIIVASDATVTTLGPWTVSSLIAGAGVLLGGVLMAVGVRGALFYTIIVMTVIGIPLGVTQLPENFSLVSLPESMAPIAFHMDFSRFLSLDINYYVVVFTLLFMDLFDTLGTLIGASTSAGMADPRTGKIHGLNRALMADAIGTTAGALCGTSTVTTYVESTTGIAAGGRTGLTSLTVALFFLVALFFSPLFLIIPSAATTSALVLVGVLMTKTITKIDFSDFTEAVPCFITILTMPFTASISEGIVLGMLSYVLVKVCTGHYKELSIVMYILAAFFILKYVFN
ncbi:NCS2 family permease [Prevotella sp. lc2012]|uniref:NCS2 family permease n=1 Tax=Prevotella sp. lc2012 TaxID=1761886 RepID=UPI00089C02A9|nr:NCS2 family permease [Prevotella sp. lc2012]SEE45568.1 putative MFS transporter, AGZA family, xanthine/uracil permease [Prevotella sp. lc2012]